MIESKLSVRLYGRPIGILERTSQGKMHFSYHHDNHWWLSNSMPLKEKTFDHKLCRAYFGGLLPESETMKILLAKKHGFDPKDIFAFLAYMGKDCLGAVSFHRISDPVLNSSAQFQTKILSDKEISKAFSHFSQEPLFFDLFENYPLLSGSSHKVGICMVKDKIALPIHQSITTHILKVDENEDKLLNHYFCLKVARYVGLAVPDFVLKSVSKQLVLILTRFDRKLEEHHIQTFHQEDLCQALGTRLKLEQDKGPAYVDLFNLLNRLSVPARERHRMIKGIIFNYLIGHCSHGKNISLLSKPKTQWELAPFYDVECKLEQTELTMSIANKTTLHEIGEPDWIKFCEQIGYTAPIFKSILNEFSEQIVAATHRAFDDFKKEGLGVNVAEKIRRKIKENAQHIGPASPALKASRH